MFKEQHIVGLKEIWLKEICLLACYKLIVPTAASSVKMQH